MNKERLCEIDTALTSEYWQLSATDPVVVADQDDFPRKLGRVWEGSWTPLFTRSNEGINIQQQKCQKYTIIHVNCPRWDTRLSMTTALAALRWRWQTMLCVFRSSHSCVVRGQWTIILILSFSSNYSVCVRLCPKELDHWHYCLQYKSDAAADVKKMEKFVNNLMRSIYKENYRFLILLLCPPWWAFLTVYISGTWLARSTSRGLGGALGIFFAFGQTGRIFPIKCASIES